MNITERLSTQCLQNISSMNITGRLSMQSLQNISSMNITQRNTDSSQHTNAENLDSHCLIKVLTLSPVQCSHASVQQGISPGAVRRYVPIPPMAVRTKNRGGSTSIRGQVHSPHISGGRWWLSCRQPICLYPRQLHRGIDRQRDRSRYSLGQGIKIYTLAKQFNVTMLKNSQMSTESHLL